MTLLQVFTIAFLIFAISRAILRFREGALTSKEFIVWDIFWIFIGVVILYPKATIKLAEILGVGRGVDAVLYLSIMLLFYLIFRVYVRIESMEHNITKIIREIAIKNEKNKS